MRALVPLAALLAAMPLAAQERIDRRIAIASDASIRVWNMAGVTRIIGWDRDSIAVAGTVPPGAFYMGGSGRSAKLGVERPDGSKADLPATLEIRVPRNARIWIKSASASVEASGLTGEVECSSVDGSVRVEGSLKLVVAESMEGHLSVYGPMSVVRLKGGGAPLPCGGRGGT